MPTTLHFIETWPSLLYSVYGIDYNYVLTILYILYYNSV